MTYRVRVTELSRSVVLSGMLLAAPLTAQAQETAPAAAKPSSCPMCEKHAEDQSRHHQMEAMPQGMSRELEQQLTTLREHAKTLEGVSDQAQLLMEMRKHQQLTDALLGTMIEQHQKMHATRHGHHQDRHGARPHEHRASDQEVTPAGAE